MKVKITPDQASEIVVKDLKAAIMLRADPKSVFFSEDEDYTDALMTTLKYYTTFDEYEKFLKKFNKVRKG